MTTVTFGKLNTYTSVERPYATKDSPYMLNSPTAQQTHSSQAVANTTQGKEKSLMLIQINAEQELLNKIQQAVQTLSADTEAWKIEPLLGGLSDGRKKFKCTANGMKLVAIMHYAAPERRKKEIDAHTLAMKIGRAPKILYTDDDGLSIVEFVDGDTITLKEAASKPILDQVAQTCRAMRDMPVTFPVRDLFKHISANYKKLQNQNIAWPQLREIKKS